MTQDRRREPPVDPLHQATVRDRPSRPSAPSAPDDGTFPPGATLANRYRILERLGHGGMGIVYRARDLTLDADVALKVLNPEIAHDPSKVAFFRNEVRLARMVTHPNVCRLHDLEDGPEGCFITMEYVGGEPLSTRLRRGRLPLAGALAVLRDVAAGLAAAHAAGVIHRDLKPSNVLLAAGRAVVADFGIAGEGQVLASGPQDIAGTHGYMAPEQARGKPLDARADVYALGVLACVLTTGARPLPVVSDLTGDPGGGSASALPIADPRPLLAELPPRLADLIASCLAPEPVDRPADAGAVSRRLDELALGALARPRRRRAVALGAIVVAIAGVAGAAWSFRHHAAAVVVAPIAPRVFVAPVDGRGLQPADGWVAAAVQRALVDELIDGWGLDAHAGAAPSASDGRPQPSRVLAAAITREPRGGLRLVIDGTAVEGRTPQQLAIAAASSLVPALVPDGVRRPTAKDLRDAGTTDPEAWRLWRRAQRESLLQRWSQTTALCDAALRRDPGFPLARLESAFSYDGSDRSAAEQLRDGARLLAARQGVDPMWAKAVEVSRRFAANDLAGGQRLLTEILAMDVDPVERMYVETRFAMGPYFGGSERASLPALELITERYPEEAAAFKLLADYYVHADDPSAPALALKNAERAVALEPGDAGARADLAVALLIAGRRDDARARADELAQLDPDDKRLARSRLFALHMALGDPAEAEIDARRQLTGSAVQQAEGTSSLAVLDLYWGRFDAGLRGLEASAAAYDALGMSFSAAGRRFTAAKEALRLGRTAEAQAGFARVATAAVGFAPLARVLEQIAAGRLDLAHTRATEIVDDAPTRAAAELVVAAAAHQPAAVIDAYARLEKLGSGTGYLYEVGTALEQTGRRDDASALYQRLVLHPYAWAQPIASVRAWYRLGLLRTRAGDRAGALAALTEVLRRWSEQTSASPEVTDARLRLRAH